MFAFFGLKTPAPSGDGIHLAANPHKFGYRLGLQVGNPLLYLGGALGKQKRILQAVELFGGLGGAVGHDVCIHGQSSQIIYIHLASPDLSNLLSVSTAGLGGNFNRAGKIFLFLGGCRQN
jgi:hypothetical protein